MKSLLSLTAVLANIFFALCIAAGPLQAKSGAALVSTTAITDLETALTQAAKQKKSLFIVYGRDGCNNCRTLHHWIDTKKLPLPGEAYLIAKLNCDDSAQREAFYARFSVESRTLPFVVVTTPSGDLLASRTGYGTLPEYKSLLREATKQAAALQNKQQ